MIVGVVQQPGLIAPMNFGGLRLGSFGNGWLRFIQPFSNCFRILFICADKWLLWGKSPALQIFPNRPNRHLNRIQLVDQLLDRNSCPQGKRQFQLIRATIFYRPLKFALLIISQCAADTLAAASALVCDRFLTALLVSLPPLAYIGGVNANDLADFLVRPTGFTKPDGLIAKFLLYLWFQLSCICLLHTRCYIINER